ncbi:adenosine deaminase [Fusarium beomiforme]|uniref:adenosine deaminase n=1 Tax=Fusarium beomiforme TaxID=44412 RepID=A0A9P5DXB6_9HYPO|nr:adenosine deaminase [Fusarium beomiforme]
MDQQNICQPRIASEVDPAKISETARQHPSILQYHADREALIQSEKTQRHDVAFAASMSPVAKRASALLASLRQKELREIWNADLGVNGTAIGDAPCYGMAFPLSRNRMETTKTWEMLDKMPKGALLHAHFDAMVDVDWLVERCLREPNLCLVCPVDGGLLTDAAPRPLVIFDDSVSTSNNEECNIWSSSYRANNPMLMAEAKSRFLSTQGMDFEQWIFKQCILSPDDSLLHHQGIDAIWQKFQNCIPFVGEFLFYEPVFRDAMQRLLGQLAGNGIMYVDFRLAFNGFRFRRAGRTEVDEDGVETFFRAFGDEIEKFKQTVEGACFQGARMIWTAMRGLDDESIVASMKDCLRIKSMFPHLICGFDFVGQEDIGRPLVDLAPLALWFQQECAAAGVEIPFFLHAGECLGDGNSTDNNLFDALLLGARRIGHGFSLYKHPLLIDKIKEKGILVETCPISNEVLRLTSSCLAHPMGALLSRCVPVCLNNDDPAILGHGRNGLTHDMCQAFMASDNLGLEGLGTMAENSIKWSAMEDQSSDEWIQEIDKGYSGAKIKAQALLQWKEDFNTWCEWVVDELSQ